MTPRNVVSTARRHPQHQIIIHDTTTKRDQRDRFSTLLPNFLCRNDLSLYTNNLVIVQCLYFPLQKWTCLFLSLAQGARVQLPIQGAGCRMRKIMVTCLLLPFWVSESYRFPSSSRVAMYKVAHVSKCFART